MSDQEERAIRLSQTLVERGLVSEAQMELAMADREINDLPLEEVLLARGWISETALFEAAPWLSAKTKIQAAPPENRTEAKPQTLSSSGAKPRDESAQAGRAAEKPRAGKPDIKPPPPGPAPDGPGESPLQSAYDENLKKYREILKRIKGED